MCGIAGILGNGGDGLEAMSSRLGHRGPDDSGIWADRESGVGLAHRRLSVLDLSPAGHQPMESMTGRYVIVFNGEIYNHPVLRTLLEEECRSPVSGIGRQPSWKGHSDTETLLAGFESWGIEETLRRSVGMFALAVWDRKEKALTLARDRMGEKPLYYGWVNGKFLFASELKALRAFRDFAGDINRDALALFLRHDCIPAPYSIYRGIFKLWPGAVLELRSGGEESCPWSEDYPPFEPYRGVRVDLHWYWSPKEVAERCRMEPFEGTDFDAVDELERLLGEAVRSQQISDVPLGLMLSGGVDSSSVAALMQSSAGQPVNTFTIGFHEVGYDEAFHAGEVARHLGTRHTVLYVTPEEAQGVIPQLPAIYDEPFADPSQIPTYLVAQMARRHVTVSLSGDAGDELFGGYKRYFLMNSLLRRFYWLPPTARRCLARGISAISPSVWDGLYGRLNRILPAKLRLANAANEAHKLSEILAEDTAEAIFRRLVSHWTSPSDVVVDSREPLTSLTNSKRHALYPEIENRMMYLDAISYLPDDILVKVDRAAMSVSLETRVPFLDHRVVEFAWRMPLSMKIRNGRGKWILRQVLARYVPDDLIERPKQGFGVPIDSWLRGPLRQWAEDLLAETRLKREGYFRPEPIRRKWLEHLSGKRNWQYYIWDVLMFQAWLESIS